MNNWRRNIYFTFAALPFTSILVAVLSNDFQNGYFPSWVYVGAMLSNILMLLGAVIFQLLTVWSASYYFFLISHLLAFLFSVISTLKPITKNLSGFSSQQEQLKVSLAPLFSSFTPTSISGFFPSSETLSLPSHIPHLLTVNKLSQTFPNFHQLSPWQRSLFKIIVCNPYLSIFVLAES